MRLFVAIPLPADVRQSLALLCAGVPGARWTSAENLHLTLCFIGEVDGGRYHDVAGALGAVATTLGADGTAGPTLQLATVGQFGDRRRARVLWAGVRPNAALARLQARIEGAVRQAGLAVERRKFHAHVTLARLKGAPSNRVDRYLADHSAYQSRPFPMTEFVLFQSLLSQTGAIHHPEITFSLPTQTGDSV